MSKWNKPNKQLSQQFLQNEQRRRQMIIEASKRRREKQKKLSELNEHIKKNEDEILEKQKKEKQEAYQKYLKSNNNMHDKYEQIKRNQKMQEEPKKQVSKWKKRDNSVEVAKPVDQSLEKKQAKQNQEPEEVKKQVPLPKKGVEAKKIVAEQFEKEWADENEDELIKSNLLDSLDLDINTMERGRQLTNQLEKIKKLGDAKPTLNPDQVEEMRNLIGYDSMLISDHNLVLKNQVQSEKNINKYSNEITAANKSKKEKEGNEQETFNSLKNKKEAKILEWATIKEEADDLFSNCSSSKNSMSRNAQNNSKDKLKKILDPIPEKAKGANKSLQKQKSQERPVAANTPSIPPKLKVMAATKSTTINEQPNKQNRSMEKPAVRQQASRSIEKASPSVNRSSNVNNENRSDNAAISKQKIKQNQAAFQKDREKSMEKLRDRKFSAEKANSAEKLRPAAQQEQPRTQQPFRSQKPLPPIAPKAAFTVATHQQYFDVESFIMNDLVQLNEEERKLQQEIRNIHLENKAKVKDIETKYDIKTNYKNSRNLISKHEGIEVQPESNDEREGYGAIHGPGTEDMIEDSIQRLDDFMIKRQIVSREKTQRSEESQIKSIINPFSKPEDFQKQILQLAENISRFEEEKDQQDKKGYGYQHMQKKKPFQKVQIAEQISVSRATEQPKSNLQRSKKTVENMGNPPLLQYSSKDNEVIDVNLEQQYFDPEDSLDTMVKQKVQVNEKLRNILFDD